MKIDTKNLIKSITENLEGLEYIKLDEIPGIDLYMDQVTTLMDKKFFRRDQIWFVQKDEYGYSELVALSDFKVRSDASFEKDYLAGVYGGIPLIKEYDMKEGE